MARKKKTSKDAENDVEQTASGDAEKKASTDIDKSTDDAATKAATDEVEQPAQDDGTKASETIKEPGEDTGSVEPDEVKEEEVPDEAPADDTETEASENSEPPPEITDPPVPTPPVPVVVRQGGFIPLVLGGIIAAAIGFGVAKFVFPVAGPDAAALANIETRLDGQASAVSVLSGRVDALESGGDLGDLQAAHADNLSAISGLADQLADIETRLKIIETRPAGEGVTADALVTYDRQLDDLRSLIDEMSQNAAQMEENAQASARATLGRAALTRIQTALDAGIGFETAVADLEAMGVTVPATLKEAATDGVSSLNDLQESFPESARAALSTSRAATDAPSQRGLGSFLRTQLGARSLQPREGDDPDAVLSRAEAATREGRLTDALAEIDSLPEAGRAELSDWASKAARRLEAVAAAQELGESLN